VPATGTLPELGQNGVPVCGVKPALHRHSDPLNVQRGVNVRPVECRIPALRRTCNRRHRFPNLGMTVTLPVECRVPGTLPELGQNGVPVCGAKPALHRHSDPLNVQRGVNVRPVECRIPALRRTCNRRHRFPNLGMTVTLPVECRVPGTLPELGQNGVPVCGAKPALHRHSDPLNVQRGVNVRPVECRVPALHRKCNRRHRFPNLGERAQEPKSSRAQEPSR